MIKQNKTLEQNKERQYDREASKKFEANCLSM